MMSGAPRSGSLYWLTSVPHTPAISTFSSAASDGMSGKSNSRSSVVDVPTFTAARVFPVAAIRQILAATGRDLRDRDGRRRGEWILVRARPVDRQHRHADLAQIHRELSAMVVPVVQHDHPQHASDGDRHDFTVAV